MSSLVSDFLINPVLRQARRFSEISRSTFGGDDNAAAAAAAAALPEAISDASEPEHDAHDDDAAAVLPSSPIAEPSSPVTGPPRSETAAATPSTPRTSTSSPPRDHLGLPVSARKLGGPIPEDDGMSALRTRIHQINALDIGQAEKAKFIHDILLEGYRAARPHLAPTTSPGRDAIAGGISREYRVPVPMTLESLKFWQNQVGETAAAEKFLLTGADLAPTYAPIRLPKNADGSRDPVTPPDMLPPLGCAHYERNVKLQCSTCNRWYTCRFCHDAAEDHSLVRHETKHMLCMFCGTPQKASEACVNCGETTAQYYCNICKLWENRKSKPIYHCDDCGICRRGHGLGKDFFHCKTCRACITTSIESSHKCIERSTDCDCPICGEYMFTSPKPVVFMPCGHSIHKKCYDQHMRVSYKCPICNKSLANMETQFRNLDLSIQAQPMPAEFRDTKAVVLCNDCSGRCTVPYHWLGLKCLICRSFNTVELQIIGRNSEILQAANERQEDPPVALEATSAAQPVNISTERPTGVNRRRHSSSLHVDSQYPVPDRTARSLSPQNMMPEHHTLPTIMATEDDSDNDILGIWGRSGGESSSEEGEEYESDSDDLPEMDDDEEEEEDPNEIVLIGHR
ncbi:CHY zinc finger domain protein [Cordyceps militaris CM01]|uniref:CHY zinc finger domain protein n=1 Tax=Cordyceps militaris (strain CM01) TaxID=983644 RepID=G3JSL0_CORMM|nr:CHY zinc finger domain protein [Cordyceps militaris CM01]EGX88856.1 CHY zinc finger domain protein [Cordyceps militaris CM01]